MILGLSTKTMASLGAAATLMVVAITSAVVMADGDEFDAIKAPQWQAGYAFAYDVTGEIEYMLDVPGEASGGDSFGFGPLPIEKEILSTQFDLDGKPLYVGAATFPLGHFLAQGMDFEFPDLAVYPTADRKSDLSPVGVQISDAGDDLEFGPDAPITYLDFPLQHGKRWSSTMKVAELFGQTDFLEGTEYMDLDEVLVQGEVGSMHTLDLPIGTVEAVRVDISYTPIGLQKAVAQARSDAEKFGVDVERLNVQLGVHEIAYYAPEYQSIVKDQFVVRALVDAALNYDGDHWEVYTEATGTALVELTGARLLKGPEQSTSDILRILRGEAPVADAHGEIIPESTYDLFLEDNVRLVNAASSPSLTYSTDISGVDALPTGHKIVFKMIAGDGSTYKTSSGAPSWDVVVDEPGSYTVVAQAIAGDGRVFAQDSMPLVANWHQTINGGCPLVSSSTMIPCQEVDLPVNHGVDHLTLAAYANGTSVTYGQLNVYSDSDSYQGSRDGDGAYRVSIDEFNARDIGRSWTGAYSSFGLGERVDYVIDIIYGVSEPIVNDHAGEDGSAGALVAMRDARSMSSFGSPLGAFLEQLSEGKKPFLQTELDALLS